jgi:hypothetical protein
VTGCEVSPAEPFAIDAFAPPPDKREIVAEPSKANLPNGARLGRRIGQVLFFSAVIWVIVSSTTQILAEAFFAPKIPRSAEACRAELSLLRVRLAEASMVDTTSGGELAAVAGFRNALGGEAGREFDRRALELIDGCPPDESAAAYALARLRAAQEAMVRVDVLQSAPARLAHDRAVKRLSSPASSRAPSP